MSNLSLTFLATGLIIAIFALMLATEKSTADGPGFFKRNGTLISAYLVLGIAFWMILTIVMPMAFMVDLSFRPKLAPSEIGGPKDVHTLANYRYFLFGSRTSTEAWNLIHIRAFFITILASILITLLNFVVCYPIAYYMAKVASIGKLRMVMLLLIIPYWVNDVLRAFAFRILLSENGFVNKLLTWSGIIDRPLDFLGANFGLYMALCYSHLLIMIFPLYNAIESQNRSQIEAARDLGAPWWHIHLFVVMPHAKPGIASGMTLCFMLTAGAVATPLVLGGPRTLWFTPIVYDRFYQLFDWPQGAAYAFILLLACIVFVLTVLKLTGLKLGEITR